VTSLSVLLKNLVIILVLASTGYGKGKSIWMKASLANWYKIRE